MNTNSKRSACSVTGLIIPVPMTTCLISILLHPPLPTSEMKEKSR